MSITDELREWARCNLSYKTRFDELIAIADRIDAEHEKAIRELNNLADASVLLPVDADGVLIRVGDVLDGYGKTIEVVEMRHGRSGWVLISREGNGYADTFAFSHHHAPTVEDVLREFTDAVLEWAGKSGTVAEVGTWSDVAAEYAAKLRLAGEK